MVADPEIFALVFAAAELSPEAVSVAAGLYPEVVSVSVEPEVFAPIAASEFSAAVSPEIFALVFVVAELSPEVASVDIAASVAAEPEVASADIAASAAVEPEVASVDIAAAFVVLVPVSVVAGEVDSSGRPMFLAFPNVEYYANCSSSDEVLGKESVHSSTGARTNYGLCSILSNPGPHQNRSLGHYHSNPSPGHNNVSGTNDLPIDATTNHSRKKSLHLYQEQRTHRPNQAAL